MRSYNQGMLPASLFAATALLVGGYIRSGFWWAVPAAAAVLPLWWIAKRMGWRRLPSALLVLCVAAGAGGVLGGVSPLAMIAGVTAGLVSWELANHGEHRNGGAAQRLYRSFDRSHSRLLAATAGLGLLLAAAGLYLELPIPFGGMVLAGLLVLFSLFRFYQLLVNA